MATDHNAQNQTKNATCFCTFCPFYKHKQHICGPELDVCTVSLKVIALCLLFMHPFALPVVIHVFALLFSWTPELKGFIRRGMLLIYRHNTYDQQHPQMGITFSYHCYIFPLFKCIYFDLFSINFFYTATAYRCTGGQPTDHTGSFFF